MSSTSHYYCIAQTIEYIRQHFKNQPSLDELAANVHLSPYHFQRLFTEWAGVSPKQFLQYTSLAHAKHLLHDKKATLFDAAYETGLSSTGRLHDLFIKIEGMTPGEYKNQGENLAINYSFSETPFGDILVASTHKGICYIAFIADYAKGFSDFQQLFPNANFIQINDSKQQNALQIFSKDWSKPNEIKLHLKGTAFQLKVWEALLKIPLGQLSTYGKIASKIQISKASRAVGTAIGCNPIAYLIPCHRVIQSTGNFGGYMWGITRKTAIIGWEAAKNQI